MSWNKHKRLGLWHNRLVIDTTASRTTILLQRKKIGKQTLTPCMLQPWIIYIRGTKKELYDYPIQHPYEEFTRTYCATSGFLQENCIEEANLISKDWLGKQFSNCGQLARKKQETGTLLYQGSCKTSVLLLWISEGFLAFVCSWRLLATGTPVHRLKALTSSLCSWFPCLDWAIAAHCQPESFRNLHGNFKIRIQNNPWSQYGQQLGFKSSVLSVYPSQYL